MGFICLTYGTMCRAYENIREYSHSIVDTVYGYSGNKESLE